jgi:limonene-1,2-epoxide hydrolase
MDRIQGKEAIRAANAAFMDMIEAAPWKVRNIFEAPNGTVLTERDDIFVLKDGRTVNCPVMGAFEINEDNKITHWRDYFDLGDWNRQLGMDPDLGRRSNPAP